MFVHHSTFCVNSLAHWLGDATFDSKHTPRDHFFTALVTVGEGYHNFHHQFPMDYRNATKWHQYDPTKWFIIGMKYLGLAYDLKEFPADVVNQGVLTMKLQKLHEEQAQLSKPKKVNNLPIVSWEEFQEESKTRKLVAIQGIVHDVSSFIKEHPGGYKLIASKIGKDASTAFFGGVYDHSNAAQNLLATMRVGVIDGGYELAINALNKIRAEREVAQVDVDAPEQSEDKKEVEKPSTQEDDGPRKANEKAANYVIPSEAYKIEKRADLGVNVVAQKHGGKVGALLWG